MSLQLRWSTRCTCRTAARRTRHIDTPSELRTCDCMPDRLHCPRPATTANSACSCAPVRIETHFKFHSEESFQRNISICVGRFVLVSPYPPLTRKQTVVPLLSQRTSVGLQS